MPSFLNLRTGGYDGRSNIERAFNRDAVVRTTERGYAVAEGLGRLGVRQSLLHT